MTTFILLVTFCNVYHDTCDYDVVDYDLSYEDCRQELVEAQKAMPEYMWECAEEDKE